MTVREMAQVDNTAGKSKDVEGKGDIFADRRAIVVTHSPHAYWPPFGIVGIVDVVTRGNLDLDL
jgi:hypothetical protein